MGQAGYIYENNKIIYIYINVFLLFLLLNTSEDKIIIIIVIKSIIIKVNKCNNQGVLIYSTKYMNVLIFY